MASIEGNISFNAVVYTDNSEFQYLRNVARNKKLYLRCIQHPSSGEKAVLWEVKTVVKCGSGVSCCSVVLGVE